VRHLAVTRRPTRPPRPGGPRTLRWGHPGDELGAGDGEAACRRRAGGFRDADALLAGPARGAGGCDRDAPPDYALASNARPRARGGAFIGSSLSGALAVRPDDGRSAGGADGYLAGMRQARHALMFKYLSEEALSLIAASRVASRDVTT